MKNELTTVLLVMQQILWHILSFFLQKLEKQHNWKIGNDATLASKAKREINIAILLEIIITKLKWKILSLLLSHVIYNNNQGSCDK